MASSSASPPAPALDAERLGPLLRGGSQAPHFGLLAPPAQAQIVAHLAALPAAAQAQQLEAMRSMSMEDLLAMVEAPRTTPRPTAGAGADATQVTVRRGDTLGQLARQHHSTVAKLVAANPAIKNPDLIYPGQVITVPPV